MNIALFAEVYKPYVSGVTRSIENLVQELRMMKHGVKVFCPHYPEHQEKDPDVHRFFSIGTKIYPQFRLAFPYSRKIIPQIPKMNLEIIHSHSPYQMGRLAMRWAKKLKIPYVYTFHTLVTEYLHYIPFLSPKIAKPLVEKLMRNFCNKCDCIIVPTERVKHLLEKGGVKTRLEVVPSGVDFNAVASARPREIRKKYGISPKEKILLYVGRLSYEKNVSFLFKSFKNISKVMPDARLMLVAGGPKEKELKEEAEKLGIAGKTIFTGQVKPTEVFNYYKAGDVFTFSSLTETQGLVLAEAKAAGLPVVAIDAQGVGNMVKDGEDGFLVKNSLDQFTKGVKRLLKSEELRKKMGQKAFRNAQKEFSSAVAAKKIAGIYESLISAGTGRS